MNHGPSPWPFQWGRRRLRAVPAAELLSCCSSCTRRLVHEATSRPPANRHFCMALWCLYEHSYRGLEHLVSLRYVECDAIQTLREQSVQFVRQLALLPNGGSMGGHKCEQSQATAQRSAQKTYMLPAAGKQTWSKCVYSIALAHPQDQNAMVRCESCDSSPGRQHGVDAGLNLRATRQQLVSQVEDLELAKMYCLPVVAACWWW